MPFSVRYKDFYNKTIYEGLSIPYKFEKDDEVFIKDEVWVVISTMYVPETNTLIVRLDAP